MVHPTILEIKQINFSFFGAISGLAFVWREKNIKKMKAIFFIRELSLTICKKTKHFLFFIRYARDFEMDVFWKRNNI